MRPGSRFFQQRDPGRIFDHPIESAFPDGMRCCEYLLRDFANTARYCRRSSVIALHDCVPVEIAIADQKAAPSVEVSRAGSSALARSFPRLLIRSDPPY